MKKKTQYGQWVIKNRWIIVIVSIIIFAVLASGARFLNFINDGRVFFNKEDPRLIALEEIENSYTKNDNVFFGLEPKKGDIFTKEALASAEELTRKSWQIPYSSRVDSLTNFQHTTADKDDLIVKDLVTNAKTLTDEELLAIKKAALSDPTLTTRLVSPNGDMMGVNVTILKPGKKITENSEVMAFVNILVEEFKNKFPDMNIYVTGGLPFDNAFGEVSQDDMSTLVPSMYLLMILLVWLLLRTITGAVSTLLVIAFSCFSAMGITGWIGISLTPASVSAPTIILTLSVADSIHILSTMLQEMRLGKSKHDAIIESMRINLQPVFLTSLTTAIGFLSMNASDAPPFRDLGNIVAIGVTAAFIYSVLFLPAILAILPIRIKSKIQANHIAAVDKLGNFVVNRQNALFWGMLGFILFIVSGIYFIDLNDRFVEYFDPQYKIRTDTDYITDKNLTGMDIIEYSIGSGESNGIVNPQYLLYLEAFAAWYKNQPDVVHVDSFTHVMKRINKSMHGDKSDFYRIPENRSLAAQFLLLYEMSLPFGLDLNNQINVDKSATRFMVTTNRLSTKELRHLEMKARQWMKQNLPKHMFAYGSGISIVWAHISDRNINTMLSGTLIALLLISGILVVALKSLKYGLISLIPNLMPAFMAFGLWGYFVGEAGLAVSVVGAMSLGIVVDDTIHFLTKYIRAKKEFGLTSKEAVKKSFHTVGGAIVTTTVVLVSGFLVLTFSGFLLNSAMGSLTAIALIFALVADCLFLPPLLIKADKIDFSIFSKKSELNSKELNSKEIANEI